MPRTPLLIAAKPARMPRGPKVRASDLPKDSVRNPGDRGYSGRYGDDPKERAQWKRRATLRNMSEATDESYIAAGRKIGRVNAGLAAGLAGTGLAGGAAIDAASSRRARQIRRGKVDRQLGVKKRWETSMPFVRAATVRRGVHDVSSLPPRKTRSEWFAEAASRPGVSTAMMTGAGLVGGTGLVVGIDRGEKKVKRASRDRRAQLRRQGKLTPTGQVSKSRDSRDSRAKTAALLGTGTAAGVVATRHNAIANAVNARHERRVDRQIADRQNALARTKNPTKRDLQGRPIYQSQTQRRDVRRALAGERRKHHGAINELNRRRKKVPFTPRGRSHLLRASAAVAVPSVWLGVRGSVDKADVRRRDVDAAVVGGAAGAGLYQGAGYALKPLDRRAERKIAEDPKLSARARAHRRKMGVPSNPPAGHPSWRPYFRAYPKDLPGGRLKRTLALTHTGRSGVAATAAMGGLGAAMAGTASARGRKEPVHKALYRREEKLSPSRALGALAGGALAMYGLGHSKMVGRAIARGVKMAQGGQYNAVADALRRADAARGSIRAGMAPGEAAIRRVQALNTAIERVPRSVRPEVALVAGTMLVNNSTPVRRTSYRPVSYPVYR